MGNFSIPDWAEQALGAVLVLLILLDVFLTVLYARAGIGIVSNLLAALTWRFFHLVSKPFGKHRGTVLSLCGPALLVMLVLVWGLALTVGVALVIHPALGTGVTAGDGETPTDFVTAMFAAGGSLAFVGTSDFAPETGGFQILYLLKSLIGTAVISLVLAYLMQVYTALQERNALALQIHLATNETGDAAEMLAGMGAEGKFENCYENLAQIASEMTQIKESHHFYAVLLFFRFRETYYSMSQTTLVALDAVSLIKSALDNDEYKWLKKSMSTTQLERASMNLIQTMAETFLSGGKPDQPKQPDAQTLDNWRRRFFAALRLLEAANIKIVADREAGFRAYVKLRTEWNHYLVALASPMAYEIDEIDAAGNGSQSAAESGDLRATVHSTG